ncbi:MAG: LysM peptidoglycan-binding domain-containing protein [Dehalococcoidia bacterium]|nr:LysM peptidoglycan-binding domain-containing protein [Dehalococcoidia bacterium]
MERAGAPEGAGRTTRRQFAFLGASVALLVACSTQSEVQVAPSSVPTATPYAALPAATIVAKAPPPTPPPVFTPPASPTPEIERVTYQLAAGDNPSSVAAKFSVTLAELLKANNITNPSSLQIGQVLVIPVTPTPGVTAAGPAPTESATARATGTSTPVAPRASDTQTYTVKSGDNASTIAGSFGTTVAELARLNGTSEAALRNLQIGQQLQVPAAATSTPTAVATATGTPSASATATPTAGTPSASATPSVPAGSDVYFVKAGDTAIDIASVFRISVARLAAANNVTEADLRNLQIGQRLIIPGP